MKCLFTMLLAGATFFNAASSHGAPIARGQTAPEFTGIDKWLGSQPLTM